MLTVGVSGLAEIMKMGPGPPTSFCIKAFWTHLSAYIGEKVFAFHLCVGWVACILLSCWCIEGKTAAGSHQTQLLLRDARGGEHSVQRAWSPSYKMPTLLQKHKERKLPELDGMAGSRTACAVEEHNSKARQPQRSHQWHSGWRESGSINTGRFELTLGELKEYSSCKNWLEYMHLTSCICVLVFVEYSLSY